jgi:hypothetical protein
MKNQNFRSRDKNFVDILYLQIDSAAFYHTVAPLSQSLPCKYVYETDKTQQFGVLSGGKEVRGF